MSDKVGVIDCGINNMQSIIRALTVLNVSYTLVHNGDDLHKFTHIILPGVGAFEVGARNLDTRGFQQTIRSSLDSGGKLLGVCLGMQLLFEGSEEYNTFTPGLGLIKGFCRKIPSNTEQNIFVPHIGWNTIDIVKDSSVFTGVDTNREMYFIHSYHVVPEDDSVVSSRCRHGIEFVSSVESGHVYGFQFHPEKSYANGFHILKNFLNL